MDFEPCVYMHMQRLVLVNLMIEKKTDIFVNLMERLFYNIVKFSAEHQQNNEKFFQYTHLDMRPGLPESL